jgi:hypothetical protein
MGGHPWFDSMNIRQEADAKGRGGGGPVGMLYGPFFENETEARSTAKASAALIAPAPAVAVVNMRKRRREINAKM